MQMNGKRSCKLMLLEDWNNGAEESEQLTERRLTSALKALDLKPGKLTAKQVRHPSAAHDKVRSRGRRLTR